MSVTAKDLESVTAKDLDITAAPKLGVQTPKVVSLVNAMKDGSVTVLIAQVFTFIQLLHS